MKNILTFDVEDWYHPHLIPRDTRKQVRLQSRVVEPTLRILRMLADSGNQATFFVLGCIAEAFPDLVRRIQKEGHEVASHGYGHHIVHTQNRHEFIADLQKSKSVLTCILKEPVVGYRAPSWSLNDQTHWVLEELYKNGFRYDSSHFPFETFLYGSNAIPRFMHRVKLDSDRFIAELPPSVIQVYRRRLPFCGGFYFRLLPYWFVRFAVHWINRRDREPALLYLHPWELDPNQPRLLKKWPDRFIQYHRLETTERKLHHLLKDFRFVSIRRLLTEKGWMD